MPENRVVELRVHGVGGPTPASVLETVEPIPIDGADGDLAGFYTREEKGPSGQDVEAFVWGGLTSRAAIQAAWWLLLPFALVNVAGWMTRAADTPTEDSGKTVAWWIRFLLTVAGLFVTALYLLWSAVALIDIGAYQCGGQADCVSRSWMLPLRWLAGHPMWRIAVGGFLLMAILVGLLFAARLSHKRYEEYEPDETRRRMALQRKPSLWTRNDGLTHPLYWYNWKEWWRLYLGHAFVGLATASAVIGYAMAVAHRATPFPDAASWSAALVWSIVLAVVALGAMILLLRPATFDDTGGRDARRRLRWLGGAVIVVIVAAGAFYGGWAYYGRVGNDTPLEGGLGLMTAIAWLFGIQVVALLPGLLLVAGNFWSHFRWRRFFGLTPPVNDGFRLWPPVVATVAGFGIANAGFGAVVVRLTDYLDRDGSTVTFGSAQAGFLASPGLAVDIFVVGLIFGLVLLVAPMLKGLLTRSYEGGVETDYPDIASSGRRERFMRKVTRARIVSQIGRNADRFLTGLTIGIVAASTVVFARLLLDHDFADIVEPFVGLGSRPWKEGLRNTASVVLLLYVFPGALIVRAGARNQGTRRQVGKVWDSITFFPRRFHPLGPPCYAERAVPMLREYLRERVAAGEKVVIRAHSQGTVLSVAVVSQVVGESLDESGWIVQMPDAPARPSPAEAADAEQQTKQMIDTYTEVAGEGKRAGRQIADHLALVTLGSPLGTLHGPYFPGYFSKDRYEELRAAMSGRWKNFYRETDYIGKSLFVDPEKELTIHGHIKGTTTRPDPPDHSILDPIEAFGTMQTHSGYHKAEEVRTAIAEFAEGFGATPPATAPRLTLDLRSLAENEDFRRAVADVVADQNDEA